VAQSKKKNKKEDSAANQNGKKQDLKALYAKMRRKFSAADLQKHTVIEQGIPARQVLAEMEEIHRKATRKRASAYPRLRVAVRLMRSTFPELSPSRFAGFKGRRRSKVAELQRSRPFAELSNTSNRSP
jgi:hypothetical protein